MSLRNLCNYLKLCLIMLHLELNYSHIFCMALFTADLLVSKWGMPKSNYLHPKVGFISSSNQATEDARAEFRRWDAEKRGFFLFRLFWSVAEQELKFALLSGEGSRSFWGEKKRHEQPPRGEAPGWGVGRMVAPQRACPLHASCFVLPHRSHQTFYCLAITCTSAKS